MGGRGLIAAIWTSLAVALWSLSAIIAGVVAILRNPKYLNDVMIPSLIIAGVLCVASIALARRFWRRLKRSSGGSPVTS